MPDASRKHRFFAFALAPAWTALVLTLCLIPSKAVPTTGTPNEDKLGHVLMFGVLGLLWMLAISTGNRGLWESIFVWGGGTAFGVGIEVLQGSMGLGRSASSLDALADSIGLTMGILGYLAGVQFAKHQVGREGQ